MSCQYSLLFLFLCGFTALSVSEICGRELLEGSSCTIKPKTRNNEKPNEIKWTHLSSGDTIRRKHGKIRTNTLGGKIEEDGSLTFESVSLKNIGKYRYSFYAGDGTETSGEEEINVYAKAPKPTVMFDCDADGNAVLTCDIGNHTDLIVSWYKREQFILCESEKQLFLTSAEVQENERFSCSVSNPVSNEQSDSTTVSCGESSGPRTLFGFDFWIMVGILAGSGALLLLLICALLFSSQRKKHQKDEREFRLRNLQAPAQIHTQRKHKCELTNSGITNDTSLNTHKSPYEF